MGHALPLWSNAATTLALAASYYSYIPRRCKLSCTLPGQGENYWGLLGAAFDRANGQPGSCISTCQTIHGWLLLYFGTLLPVWVMGIIEWHAWRCFVAPLHSHPYRLNW